MLQTESIRGVVERITYHNQENGWSVLKVKVSGALDPVTVTVHQTKVFAGATFDFFGNWSDHAKYGRQFKADRAMEQKPASAAAVEKYIGSGLLHGIGPGYARKIVKHFGEETLKVFESEPDRLLEVPGVGKKILQRVRDGWTEHSAIRDVMLFLQDHDISTLFAVKIYKHYGDKAIEVVRTNPYQLSKDIYGIGFLSADRVARAMGFALDSQQRINAAVAHVLAAAREQGHCYLMLPQIQKGVAQLLTANFDTAVENGLQAMQLEDELKVRYEIQDEVKVPCYYNKTLYRDEALTAEKVVQLLHQNVNYPDDHLENLLKAIEAQREFPLSEEQRSGVKYVVNHSFSILTGGPGCGKTTTTHAVVQLLLALNKKILLAAPTGRAAQRMGEVIGREAKTIHRLLEFNPAKGGFQRNEGNFLECDFLIVDECSMLDISLSASLLEAVGPETGVLFIGDPDQLPSVGAGNVLRDLITSPKVPVYRLTKVYRQAAESKIITYAHQINKGEVPRVQTPFKNPALWNDGEDCMFVDAEEATQEQIRFLKRGKQLLDKMEQERTVIARNEKKDGPMKYELLKKTQSGVGSQTISEDELEYGNESSQVFTIPDKFRHVNMPQLMQSQNDLQALKTVLKKVHPYSALHYGFTASDILVKLYKEIIPKYHGAEVEIQVLSPMTKGSMGTVSLNKKLQQHINPLREGKRELKLGERIFREGDRVIQRRNNYDLEVFNGDIGKIFKVDLNFMLVEVAFGKGKDHRVVTYEKANLVELDLAYAITIHKSQGSEFDVVLLPVSQQHYSMLFRNLIYTGLTRAKKRALFVGTRFALGSAIRNVDNRKRQTKLMELLEN